MKRIYIISLFIVSLLASGCRKDMPELVDPRDGLRIGSWSEVFKTFWTGMNNNYAFWDVDPTDWDAVYEKYTPVFDTLSVTNPHSEVLALQYFEEMTSTLIDHHFTLSFIKKINGVDEVVYLINPGGNELMTRDYYHFPLTYDQFDKVIEKNSSRISSDKYFEVKDQQGQVTFYAHSYLLDGNIAYFRFSAFEMYDHISSSELVSVLNNFNDLVHQTPHLKGVIIDTRSNFGGRADELTWCAGLLVSERKQFAETRNKSGMGRLDYAPWAPMFIRPYKKGVTPPDVPIVSLVDIYSASMGEVAALALRSLPRGILIGERTCGAHGGLMDNFSLLAGEFSNLFFKARTSSMTLRTQDGEILEGKGVTPDIIELYNEASFDRGVDNQLERAVRYISTGN